VRVVQERGGDGSGIKLQAGDSECGVEPVNDVGMAGLAKLAFVVLFCEVVGLFLRHVAVA